MIQLIRDDCRRSLPGLPAERYRCCVTSPPYWEQRAYLLPDHPDKALEIGHEQTPVDYVAALVGVFREVRRVLTADGTLWLNIGDKYSNDPGGYVAGGTSSAVAAGMAARGASCGRLGPGRVGLPEKNLIGLPWRVAFALQDDGWILRSEIIWSKPNPMPHPVSDRPTTAHEHVFLFSKEPHYFYDTDAIREPCVMRPQRRSKPHKPRVVPGQPTQTWGQTARAVIGVDGPDLGRNARTVWSIQPEHGDGAHVAPMPSGLARRCIMAGSAHGDEVLDPFGGSGTVGRVAAAEGRSATLIDLDARAVAIAGTRTEQQGLCPRKPEALR